MTDLGPATEDEVVMAFLKAEIKSPRFATSVQRCLQKSQSDHTLIDSGDIGDANQNGIRKKVLGCYRGFGANSALFVNFPGDVTWRHVALDASDFEKLRYIKETPMVVKDRLWTELSGGSRLVSLAAQNVDKKAQDEDERLTKMKESILAVAEAIGRHETFPEIIAVKSNDGPVVLIEGATRSTAYALTGKTDVNAIVGTSPSMQGWIWY
jgi:hypothetical protein